MTSPLAVPQGPRENRDPGGVQEWGHNELIINYPDLKVGVRQITGL